MNGHPDPATAAFEQLRNEVALLRRAVEGLAAQGDGKPVNYSPTLGKISKAVAEVAAQVDGLAHSPALTMEKKDVVAAVAGYTAHALATPLAEFARGRDDMKQAVARLGQAEKALTMHSKSAARRSMAMAAAAAVVATWIAWIGLSGPVARALPARWQVAERMAAATLARPRWDAGVQLMSGAAPAAWAKVRFGHGLVLGNEDALTLCLRRAEKVDRPVTCQLKVAPSRTALIKPGPLPNQIGDHGVELPNWRHMRVAEID